MATRVLEDNLKKPEQIIVKGLVIPSDWYDYGDIVRISIATSNENEYLVRKNKNENILRQRL
jgi:hypothetical protein